ncbi:MAG: glutathione S-transferase family protein [Hyphomicrobiaceae bacterium]|nr:glutathione S-transferase family protein [Hyphomicrobiaceae bacterium]
MFTIYGRPNSSNVRKVLWLCAEIGQTDYQRIDCGRGFESCDTPEYAELNPNKLVPTFVDGDLVIWESNAILRYLAAKYGEDSIYPGDLATRAMVDQWMEWQTTTSNVGIRDLFFGLIVKDPSATGEDTLSKAHAQATQAMTLLDAQLAKTGAFVTGENFTIADCALGIFVNRWFSLPIDRPDLSALATYYDRLKSRKAFEETVIAGGP